MAASAILDIPTIPGESNVEKFKGKIEIDNFNWGQSQSGSSQFGSGSGAGKVSFHDFSFTKHTDKSSPKLFEKCATGEHIPNATLILRKSGDMGGELVEFFRAEFTDLIVSSFQTSGHDGDAGLPTREYFVQLLRGEEDVYDSGEGQAGRSYLREPRRKAEHYDLDELAVSRPPS